MFENAETVENASDFGLPAVAVAHYLNGTSSGDKMDQ